MAKKKISTILGLPEVSKMHEVKLLDNIAQRIFVPQDPEEMDNNTRLDYYVVRIDPLDKRFGHRSHMKSEKIENEVFNDLTQKMGMYEHLIWSKMVNPSRNVLLIVGGVGCGKTMTTLLINDILKKIPHHCEEINKSQEDKPPLCKRKRLHIVMNFNEFPHKHVSDFEEAYIKFTEELADRLSSNLHNTVDITEKMEFIDFWNSEISREDGTVEYAFSKIINEMRKEAGHGWKDLSNGVAVDIRKDVFKKIEKDPFLFLDYQCRFWRYIRKNVYGGNRECIVAILDNIDCASPPLQAAVRKVIISHSKRFGNTFVVPLRPETIMAKPTGVAASLIDVEPHCGPESFDVIIDRLKRFIDSPGQYYRTGELSETLEEHVYKVAKSVYSVITEYKMTTKPFIESIAGSNIRAGLVMATNLLKLEIGRYDISPHDITRALVSYPYQHYSWTENKPVENIFNVFGAPEGRFLIKGRILKFIRLSPQNFRRISEISTMLGYFGYQPDLICEACNELMKPAHQLIISDTKEEYSLKEFITHENDKLILTYAGMGYTDKLISDFDYISMIIPDCVIDTGDLKTPIKRIGYGQILQRLRFGIEFLGIINKIDYKETIDLKVNYSEELYTSIFGKTMLTWDIINSSCESISYILYSLEKKDVYLNNPVLFGDMIHTYLDIENVLNLAADYNDQALGQRVGYKIPRSHSEDIRNEILKNSKEKET